MRFIRLVIVLILISILFLAFLWLFNNNFVVRGVWQAETSFSHSSKLIKIISSWQQKIEENKNVAVFEKLPAEFLINKPGLFDALNIQGIFKTSASAVRVGVVAQKDPWQIKEKTIYHRDLENLSWNKIEKDDAAKGRIILWQKEKIFKNVDEFINNPPPPEKILALNYDWQKDLNLANYAPRFETRHYEISLRGPQTIYTYFKNENLNWRWRFQDVNRHDGADEILIRVYNAAGEQVFEDTVKDDGDEWASNKASQVYDYVLNKNFGNGVFKIQISAPDDIFVRSFETAQQKFVFQYVIYAGDVNGFSSYASPIYLFGQTKNLTLRTPHQEGRQTVYINNKNLILAQDNENYKFNVQNELTYLVLPKPDVKVDFDGFLALSKDAFFLPKPLGFEKKSDLEQFKTSYLLVSDYDPIISGNYIRSEANFSLSNVEQKSGLEIFFDATSEKGDEPLVLSQIKVSLKRPPLDWFSFYQKFLTRLRKLYAQ